MEKKAGNFQKYEVGVQWVRGKSRELSDFKILKDLLYILGVKTVV